MLWITALVLYAGESGPAGSQSSEAGSSGLLSLAGIPEAVRSGNLRLKADRWRIQEARARLWNAGRWQNPAVEINYKDDPESAEFSGEIGFSQAFPLAGRLRREKAAAASLLATAAAEVADRERLLITEAKIVAVKILALQSQKRLRDEQLKIAKELTAFVEASGAKGEVSLLDAGQAKLVEAQLELEIHHLEHDVRKLESDLRPLIGLEPTEVFEVTGELPRPDVLAAGNTNIAWRPDYQAALKRAETASREIRLEQSKRWRDVVLGLFVRSSREEDVPAGFERESRIGVRLIVPLPLWNKNRAAIEEKAAKAARLEQTVRALANEIRNDTASASGMMTILAVHVGEIQNELLPAASEHVRQTDAAYKKGLIDLRTLLQSRRQRVDIEIRLLDAVRDYSLARIRYEAAAGGLD